MQLFKITSSTEGAQLQHTRTLRGHAGRVRTVAWLGSPSRAAALADATAGDNGNSGPADRTPRGGPDGSSSRLSMVLSGSEDQTVRSWTIDPDHTAAAAKAATPAAAAAASAANMAAAAAAGSTSAADPQQQAKPALLPAAVAAAMPGSVAAAAAAKQEPLAVPPLSLPQQQPTLQRSPTLSDGMSLGGSSNLPPAAALEAHLQQSSVQSSAHFERAPGSPPAAEFPSGKLDTLSSGAGFPSGEVETLSTVVAASPGRLRYGGLPPQQPPEFLTQQQLKTSSASSPCGTHSGNQQLAQQMQPAEQIGAGPIEAGGAAAPTASQTDAIAAPAAAAASTAARSWATAAAPLVAAPAAGSAKRSRNAKAPSLGARPLPLDIQPPRAAATALAPPAAGRDAIAACLQLSQSLSAGGPAGGAAAGGLQGGDADAALLRSWGVFEGPLEAEAALQTPASAAPQVIRAGVTLLLLRFLTRPIPRAARKQHFEFNIMCPE